MKNIERAARRALTRLGLRKKPEDKVRMPVELSPEECDILRYVKTRDFTMTSYERLWTTLMACKYAIDQGIAGDFVECGVWRGGHAMVAAAMFRLHGADKKVWLYDTFEGMTAPTDKDRQVSNGKAAAEKFRRTQTATHNEWCYASLEDVRNNFAGWGLLDDRRAVFVKGDVCRTLEVEANLPSAVCVLRLDTDWYESTKKELEVLYPRLSVGGTLVLDDYGHWAGAKEATDEYFARHGNRPFLQYTDYTGRVAVKVR